jgi:hypothetical protein
MVRERPAGRLGDGLAACERGTPEAFLKDREPRGKRDSNLRPLPRKEGGKQACGIVGVSLVLSLREDEKQASGALEGLGSKHQVVKCPDDSATLPVAERGPDRRRRNSVQAPLDTVNRNGGNGGREDLDALGVPNERVEIATPLLEQPPDCLFDRRLPDSSQAVEKRQEAAGAEPDLQLGDDRVRGDKGAGGQMVGENWRGDGHESTAPPDEPQTLERGQGGSKD